MNILFYIHETLQPEIGGIHRVTDVLMKILSKDHNVYCLMAVNDAPSTLDQERFFYLPNQDELLSQENVSYANQLISQYSIRVIINQDGITPQSSIFPLSLDNKEIKVVTVVHNTLTSIYGAKGHIQAKYEMIMPKLVYKLFDKLIQFHFVLKYKKYWDLVIKNSAKVVMLSSSLESNLSDFLCKDVPPEKITSICNPVTLQPRSSCAKKEKRILFVGRLCFEKQPLLMLKIWEKIYDKHQDWVLDIVGDGSLMANLKHYVEIKGIKGVTFYGKQNPCKYYERSSIFCMTSAYEGLPLVILEAMVFGVVPFAFNSFITAEDLIEDGQNGILIKPYDIDEYSEKLSSLMNSFDQLENMSKQAVIKSKEFSRDKIRQRWEQLFQKVVGDK